MTSFFFKRLLSESRQVSFMKRWGIMLGTRGRDGRQVYTYMFRDLFAEIMYKNDNPEQQIEYLYLMEGLQMLNLYLEKETKRMMF
jgi:hypothetical protein